MSDRCEPPPELRGVDGWHWVETKLDGPQPWFWYWLATDGRGFWRGIAQTHKRYLAPVAAPAEVEALRNELFDLRCRAGCGPDQPGPDIWQQNTTIRARVARLEEALAPFAAADLWDWDVTVWRGVAPEQAQILYNSGTKESITRADLHVARAALSAETP